MTEVSLDSSKDLFYSNAFPEKLTSVDKIKYCFGNIEDRRTAIVFKTTGLKIIETLDGRLLQLHMAIESNNRTQVAFYSHQLKGSFKTMGCYFLGDVCEYIERNAQTGVRADLIKKSEVINYLVPQFKREIFDLINSVENRD